MKLSLPIQRPMIHGESPQGYALRLAEINLYGSAHWISSLMDVDTTSASGLVSMGKALKKLAELSGAEYSQLKSASYQRHKGSPHVISAFGGQLFSRSLLDFRNAKICPKCLEESRHARQVWDLSMATVCPYHQVKLIHRCPESEALLTWGRPSISFSSGEADLVNVEITPVRDQDAALARLLYKAARVNVPKCANDGFVPDAVKAMSLAELHELICFIGWAAGMMKEPSARAVPILSHRRRAEVMALVADVIFDWPGRWFEVIEKRRTSEHAVGFHKLFGGFYQRLYEKGKGSPLAILQDGFKQYCEANDLGAVVSNRGAPAVSLGGYVSAEQARKELKVGKDIFTWLISIGKIAVTTNDLEGQVSHRVQVGSIAVAREYYDGLIGTDQVRQILGVSKPLTIKILEQGLVKAVRGPTIDKYRNWVVERNAVDGFIKNVVTGASTISDDVKNDLVSVSSAIAWLRSEGIPAIQIIAAIMNGRLEYHLGGGEFTSLNDLQLDKYQLISWTDELLVKRKLTA